MAQLIKHFLPKVIPRQQSWQLFLLQEWNTIVGDLNMQVRLEKINADTLLLGVSNASWMQELYCLSDVLITKINEKLEYPHVKKLRFKCSAPKKNIIKKSEIPYKYVKEFALTALQKKALEKISDEQLKTALKNFLIRCQMQ